MLHWALVQPEVYQLANENAPVETFWFQNIPRWPLQKCIFVMLRNKWLGQFGAVGGSIGQAKLANSAFKNNAMCNLKYLPQACTTSTLGADSKFALFPYGSWTVLSFQSSSLVRWWMTHAGLVTVSFRIDENCLQTRREPCRQVLHGQASGQHN